MGAGRRQHHAQQEAMRAANAEANRQQEMMRQQQAAFEEQLKLQREAMMAQTKSLTDALAPDARKLVGGTLGAQNIGIRTAASRRKSVQSIGSGIASLRIPLNLGGGGDSGLNIG